MMAIRLILTTLLIIGVYTETGIWTALFCLLITAGLEAQAKVVQTHKRAILDLAVKLNK